jgi:ABC-type phosphate/phosphonate transport system substrate-binding protein
MIRFGVSRAHGSAKLVEGARLLTAALQESLELPVELAFSDGYEQVLDGVLGAKLELAWMPPLLHERARFGGATLVAVSQRGGKLFFRSAILVRQESAYANIADLAGARAAWSDRHSAAGHVYPRQHLGAIRLGGEEVFGSPLLAMGAVVDGKADFCAGFVSDAAGHDPARALAEIRASFAPVAEGLRVLDVTAPIPPDGIVVAAHVDGELRDRIGDALHRLHNAPAGRVAITVLMGADRLVPPRPEN